MLGVRPQSAAGGVLNVEIQLASLSTMTPEGGGQEGGVNQRSRTTSWRLLPQGVRGITLGELKTFYDSNRDWIEEKRWRCKACNFCSMTGTGVCGPCLRCGHSDGVLQSRNLYEVNERMIMPRCEKERISYVELLSRHSRGHLEAEQVPVQTFVSHWWGEEFPKFMAALERFAQLRNRTTDSDEWMLALVLTALQATLLPPLILLWSTGRSKVEMRKFRWDIERVTGAAVLDTVVRILMVLAEIAQRLRQHLLSQDTTALNHSFWICAFCNNQYAIDHAIGTHGDVSTSSFAQALHAETCKDVVAVFDQAGEIYNRVWCIFEFFMVKELLPRKFRRRLDIYMANEGGVFSEGDATAQVIHDVRRAISQINTAESKASVMEDKQIIEDHLAKLGTSHHRLDSMLRQMGRDSLYAAELRRLMPLMTFALGPVLGVLFTEWWHSTYNWSYGRRFRGVFFPWFIVDVSSMSTSIVCLVLLCSCILGLHAILNSHNGQRVQVYRTRLVRGTVLMAFPGVFYSAAQFVAYAFFDPEGWLVEFVSCSRNICSVCQVLVAMLGLLLGLLYVAVRDRRFFSGARLWIEDMIFG